MSPVEGDAVREAIMLTDEGERIGRKKLAAAKRRPNDARYVAPAPDGPVPLPDPDFELGPSSFLDPELAA